MRLYAVLLAACSVLAAPPPRATVTVLATTDLHGNIYPVDYYTGRPAARGLAKIATAGPPGPHGQSAKAC